MPKHHNGSKFYDPEFADKINFLTFLQWQFTKKSKPWPQKVENTQFQPPPERVFGNDLSVTNIGHVTFLIQTQGLNILTDPVWSNRASPFSFIGPKRVIAPGIKFADLPPIDLIWISHNHYDHLDLATILKLWKKHKPRIIVPLGNELIIKAYHNSVEVEAYDWDDQIEIKPGVALHLEPMQHWSARGLFDRNKALWAAMTIVTPGGNIYFVGDSGFGAGRYFKQAKAKFGSFRLALLPIGAYEPRWFMEYAHMNPEDAVKAYIELGAPYMVPSHYDVFKLADEGYGAALHELEKAKKKFNVGRKINVLAVGQSWQVPAI